MPIRFPSPLFRDNANLIRRRGGNLMLMHLTSQSAAGLLFQANIDSTAHTTFGLWYPVTYVFGINTGLSGLTAQYRTANSGAWTTLTAYTSASEFNGVNGVRWDYANGRAYLSVGFGAPDLIQFQVLNGATPVVISFHHIAGYYDERAAAVTASLDDWRTVNNTQFIAAQTKLAAVHVHNTTGIITALDGPMPWSDMQTWVDAGYLEFASHSRSHPANAAGYLVNGYTAEVSGSRDDILNNLTLPHELITVYIEPNGYTDATLRAAIITAGYLVDRGYPTPSPQNTWAAWSADGAYERSLFTITTEGWVDNTTYRDNFNATYDGVYAAGGIYHLMDHPAQAGHWGGNTNLEQHIDHIAGHLDVWYAALGEQYQYHYVQTNASVARVG